jgi:acetoin utilization protein AcuB
MLIQDRMTKHPLTISEDESVAHTHRYMQEQKVRHLPVLNRAGDMVGVVSESDLLKAQPSAVTSLSVWEIHTLLDRIKVKDVMVRDVITTTEDCPIEDAAQLMLEHKISCLPVVRQGKLVGLITETDLFRVFLEMFAARQKGLRITMEVPDRAGEFAKVTTAVASQGGYISASGAFLSDNPTKAGMVIKVRNVDRKVLLDALSKIEDITITDVREM